MRIRLTARGCIETSSGSARRFRPFPPQAATGRPPRRESPPALRPHRPRRGGRPRGRKARPHPRRRRISRNHPGRAPADDAGRRWRARRSRRIRRRACRGQKRFICSESHAFTAETSCSSRKNTPLGYTRPESAAAAPERVSAAGRACEQPQQAHGRFVRRPANGELQRRFVRSIAPIRQVRHGGGEGLTVRGVHIERQARVRQFARNGV